ncbi:hypothetical protein CYMTET_48576, partial [Cymbomonas tetramitiformis]
GKWQGTEVAIKRLWGRGNSAFDDGKEDNTFSEFEHEAALLANLRHPNVVLFMGACVAPPDLCLVLEFCPRGSLDRLLHKSHTTLDAKRCLRMMFQAARGMNFLHTHRPPIIHRDLKPGNLLVDKDFNVKVCDFGLSRILQSSMVSARSRNNVGTPQYCAPEVMCEKPYSAAADVYSFGVVLWEVLSRKRPFGHMETPMQMLAAMLNKDAMLPPLDANGGWSRPLQSLIDRCCSREPEERPNFEEIMHTLDKEIVNLGKT